MKKFIAIFIVVVVVIAAFVQKVAFVPGHIVALDAPNYMVSVNEKEVIIVTHGGKDGRIQTFDGRRVRDAQAYFRQVADDLGYADKKVRFFCCYTEKQQRGDIKPVVSHNDIGFVVPTGVGTFYCSTRITAVKKKLQFAVAYVFGVDSEAAHAAARVLK